MMHPERNARLGGLYLAAVAVLVPALLLLAPLLPEPIQTKWLWSIEHFQHVPIAVRIALAGCVLVTAIPSVSERLWRGMTAVRAFAGTIHISRPVRVLGFTGGLMALFWILRERYYELGDAVFFVWTFTEFIHTKGFFVTFDEPLTLLVNGGAYRLLHWLFRMRVAPAVGLVSMMGGVAIAATGIALWRRLQRDWDRVLVGIGLFFATAAVALCFAYVESYTLVTAAFIVYTYLAWECLQGRRTLLAPAVALGIGFSLHVLAGWLFPSMLFLWHVHTRGRSYRGRLRQLLVTALGVGVPAVAVVILVWVIGLPPRAVKLSHLWGMKFIFLTDPSSPFYRYPMLSVDHLAAVLNELVLTAFPGLLALGFVLVSRFAIDWEDPFLRFVGIEVAFLQLFAVTWNSEIGAYRDWDLFSLMGWGYGLIGALLLVRHVHDKTLFRRAGALLCVAALAFSVPWVLSNHLRVRPIDDGHDDVHVSLARQAVKKGHLDKARWHFQEALIDTPENVEAHFGLAAVLLTLGDRRGAEAHFRRYLELAPDGVYADRVRQTLNKLAGR